MKEFPKGYIEYKVLEENNTDIDTQVPIRGLKLNDKVSIYRKSLDMYYSGSIQRTTQYGSEYSNNDSIYVSLDLQNSVIELIYDHKQDKFMDGINEVEILKIN